MNRLLQTALLLVGAVLSSLASPMAHSADVPTRAKPNILLILADDVGFSDIGCYGGEIRTPNLDGLAAEGLRLTQFYNCARCCPSRASILTGLYPHQAGIGSMTADEGLPGYHGSLQPHCVTIAQVLKTAGYRTAMAGKWHVGDRQPPTQRGFDDFYGFVSRLCRRFLGAPDDDASARRPPHAAVYQGRVLRHRRHHRPRHRFPCRSPPACRRPGSSTLPIRRPISPLRRGPATCRATAKCTPRDGTRSAKSEWHGRRRSGSLRVSFP